MAEAAGTCADSCAGYNNYGQARSIRQVVPQQRVQTERCTNSEYRRDSAIVKPRPAERPACRAATGPSATNARGGRGRGSRLFRTCGYMLRRQCDEAQVTSPRQQPCREYPTLCGEPYAFHVSRGRLRSTELSPRLLHACGSDSFENSRPTDRPHAICTSRRRSPSAKSPQGCWRAPAATVSRTAATLAEYLRAALCAAQIAAVRDPPAGRTLDGVAAGGSPYSRM
ncbi:uncharacterized protein V1510DRAFT_229966 [Dipodascopsis tothii]|uniref:uncharacterized protein n=1 Tax=Dipodascopsis tothii TaxID=44089 RepID=UPI0034CDCD27